jgi:hypothetical protein
MHYGFHSEMARDRQTQLLTRAGVYDRATTHLADIAAIQRAEIESNRQQERRLNAASKLQFALATGRRARRVRGRLSGV